MNSSFIWKGSPIKKLTFSYFPSSGRSSAGRISIRSRQGGHKKRFRIIDNTFDSLTPAVVKRFDYDPMRNVTLSVLLHATGFLSYSVAALGLKVGDFVYPYNYYNSDFSGSFCSPSSSISLKFVAIGSFIYNLELYFGSGAKFSRSGGSSSQLIAKLKNLVLMKMPSGKYRIFSSNVRCQFGVPYSSLLARSSPKLIKAGQSRWLGYRPNVRGVAMNPVDHPHGGGEGKSSGGRCSVSPWGRLTKGKKTKFLDSSNQALDMFYGGRGRRRFLNVNL